ncbi:T9SS type A sorting domain-containing protein [Salisaeta longa]|uniref:T9SS type A sorting domain-containing protein n=1 Tax=Salisaeta longa TaxID=503170 RepID=UPI002B40018A|nr:T9SS type A sorting domain-containing protein [Salisaeta longa]
MFNLTYSDGDPGGSGVAQVIDNINQDGADGQVTGADYVDATNELSNGDFGSPGSLGATTLPVELTSFRVTGDERVARLAWTTASETNNAGFRVQQATATGAWTTLGFVAGRGTVQTPSTYTFATQPLAPGVHRFRLEQVDTDGTTAFSPVRTLRIEARQVVTLQSANPLRRSSTARLQIAVEAPQQVTAAVYNVLGQRVRTLLNQPVGPAQAVRVQFTPQDLPSGLYFVRVTGEQFSHTERITILR